jgi:alpha-amylase
VLLLENFQGTSADFIKNAYGNNDEGSFGGFPDLACRSCIQDWLWKRADRVGKYYKTPAEIGWRFDYVKGFAPWVIKDWNANVGGSLLANYGTRRKHILNDWAIVLSSVFDFAYKMNDAFDGNNLNILNDDMMWKEIHTKRSHSLPTTTPMKFGKEAHASYRIFVIMRNG